MEQSIDGNLFSSSLSEIEEKLQSGKTFHYKALKSYGTVYIPSTIEARDYYNKHLDAYEKTVIQFYGNIPREVECDLDFESGAVL